MKIRRCINPGSIIGVLYMLPLALGLGEFVKVMLLLDVISNRMILVLLIVATYAMSIICITTIGIIVGYVLWKYIIMGTTNAFLRITGIILSLSYMTYVCIQGILPEEYLYNYNEYVAIIKDAFKIDIESFPYTAPICIPIIAYTLDRIYLFVQDYKRRV